MSTPTGAPTPAATDVTTVRVSTRVQHVFDLESGDYVDIWKNGDFTPVANSKEALERINNDSSVFLQILNDGLKEHFKKQLAEDESIGYMIEDDDGNEVVFVGKPISEEKSKQLQANILMNAKLLFGFSKKMSDDPETNRKLKQEKKAKALAMFLSNPQVVEMLRAQ